jgi:hypothetical protein
MFLFLFTVWATPYTLFQTEIQAQGNANWTELCQTAATVRNLNPNSVYPLIAGSPIISAWNDAKNVYGPTGTFIGTGAQIKANAGLTNTFTTAGVAPVGGTCLAFYTGLTTNFVSGLSCTLWTTTSGSGLVGFCNTLNGFLDASSDLSCTTIQAVVCVYTGATAAPTTSTPTKSPTTSIPSFSPSTSRPSNSPTTSSPSKTPTTSQPSKTPTTSQPSKSPTTSSPSNSPVTSPPSTSALIEKTAVAIGASTGVIVVLVVGAFLFL